MTGSAQVIRANARHIPLADNTVDLVVTSPPYFALRSYQDGGEHYAGQVGDEPTPAAFVESLLEVTRECVRVLKPSGSLWVNLGDKYSQPGKGERNGQGIGGTIIHKAGAATANRSARDFGYNGVRGKSLIGIPWRYALACIDDLGLILRAEVIWSKPNGLPESVTDRVRRSHEQWFHFTLEPRYFSAVDEIREPVAGEFLSTGVRNPRHGRPGGMMPGVAQGQHPGKKNAANETDGRAWSEPATGNNPLGKLPGSVWTIPTQPLQVPAHLGVDHFAAFPMEWPRRIVTGWSPREVCVECGEGRRPVVDKHLAVLHTQNNNRVGKMDMRDRDGQLWDEDDAVRGSTRKVGSTEATITGYACACPTPDAPTTPGVVLDPFGGTGTTALVARALGRHGITIDMSADYCRLAAWRTTDPDQLAAAMQVEKPPRQVVGQTSLFDEETA